MSKDSKIPTDNDAKVLAEPCHWSFDTVVEQFEDHIDKSVPNYRKGHELVCRYSDFFLRDDSLVYEIGCSTGLLGREFLHWNRARKGLRYVGLDVSAPMIEHASKAGASDDRGTYSCENATSFAFEPCTVVMAYYTLQFIHPAFRQTVLDKIYDALEWGGALIVFEKVRAPDARFQDYAIQIYNDIKQDSGFTEEEIINKTQSLKGNLEPFSTSGNMGLMARAGFVDITSIYKWVCFEGWVAIK